MLKNSFIAILAFFLCSCGHMAEKPDLAPITTTEEQWVCTPLKPLPSDEELIEMTSHKLFLLYKDEWLGHENCQTVLKDNHDKLVADIAARAAASKK